MNNGVIEVAEEPLRGLKIPEVKLVKCDEAWIFHGTTIEIRTENLVIGGEGKGNFK